MANPILLEGGREEVKGDGELWLGWVKWRDFRSDYPEAPLNNVTVFSSTIFFWNKHNKKVRFLKKVILSLWIWILNHFTSTHLKVNIITPGINNAGVPVGAYATRSTWEKRNHQRYKQILLRTNSIQSVLVWQKCM